MSEKQSHPYLAYKMPGDGPMFSAIADELHTIVMRAAQPVRPGESIKSQMNRAWANLGKPAMWRLRSAWWRDGSGAWSAAAVRDFQSRYQAHLDREAKRADQARAIEVAKTAFLEPDPTQQTRVEYQDLVHRIAAIEKLLRLRP